ncbi:MAG TPA: flavocytochrome c [Syntrophales bacterium]|nr:flavocytochrome c [Syntrophales bacterium]
MMKKAIEEKAEGTGLSRRSILKGAVTLGAVTMGGTLALNMAVPGTAEAMVKKLPQKWDETWDVVVIGSGFAGFAAAAVAAGGGAKTVILEKMPVVGGNSVINGGGYAAWDEKLHLRQKKNLGEDSVKQHVADTLKGGDYFNMPDLVKVLAKDSPDALNWMIDEGGAKLSDVLVIGGGHTAYRAHFSANNSGKDYVDALKKIADKNGAKMALNSKVTWIWRKDADPKSPVLGVEISRRGKVLNIRAKKALILASGGFSQDLEMRLAEWPKLVKEFNCTNHKGATGEVIRYAKAVGADTLHMNFIQLFPFAEPDTGLLDRPAVYGFSGPGVGMIYVSKAGKRFVNELDRRDVCAFAQIGLGANMKPAYTIFTDAQYPKFGGKPSEVEAGMKRGRFIKGDTLAELAKKIGAPADVLEKTVKDHNRYIAEGKDAEFNKPMKKTMIAMDKGPYYALPMWPAVHHTMGGLRINAKAQVLDGFGAVIPNLYAAGEVAGGVHGSNRLGCNATADCVVFGRIAGSNAIKG